MEARWELANNLEHCLGVAKITIPVGTRLVSHDGGRTFRFEGLNALTVLTAEEVSALLLEGVLREISR